MASKFVWASIVGCVLAGSGACEAAPVPDRISAPEFSLQALIQFDCLDGIRIDPATRTITFFGHRHNSGTPLRIPYVDYLAAAVEHKVSPTFSLEPTNGFYKAVDGTIAGTSAAVLQDVTNFYDDDGKLKASSAWLLQQVGVTAEPGLSARETLSRMLRVTGDSDAADMLHLMDAVAAGGERSASASSALFVTLSISSTIDNIERAYALGKINQEQEQDEYFSVFLRAVAKEIGVDPHKYAAIYADDRGKGMTPGDAIKQIQMSALQNDVIALSNRTLWQLLQAKREIQVPPWIADNTFPAGVPRVHPVYENISDSSWLARTLFLGDVALKSIVSIGPVAESELSAAVPGYVSERAFLKSHGRPNQRFGAFYQRAMITPAPFELVESPDGNALRFGKTPMAIKVVKLSVTAAGQAMDVHEPLLDAYSALLSNQYDNLAVVFPTLYKLREAAKVVAVARWLERHGVTVSFPSAERLTWQPPASIRAFVSPRLEIQAGHIEPFVNVSGGVALTPESNWSVSRAPVDVPTGDSSVAAPNAAPASTLESDVQKFVAAAPNLSEKAGRELQVAATLVDRGDGHGAMVELDHAVRSDPGNPLLLLFAAQAHFNGGDSPGATQLMQAYLRADPDNVPAQRMLAHFQAPQPSASAGQTGVAAGSAGPSRAGAIAPIEWNGAVSRAYYATDERAPELTDIHVKGPHRPAALPLPPPVPDSIQFFPEVVNLRQKRIQLTQEYYLAPASQRVDILTKINQTDGESVKTVATLGASADGGQPVAAVPAAIKPEPPKKKPHRLVQ